MLDQTGKQLGVMTKQQALDKARELGVDVVEIAPQAKPPVVKLISFSKFKYQLQQKAQEEKKKTKNVEIKELRFTPVIAQGDFDSRVKRARSFLTDGDKVRIVIKFKGREITKKELGERIAVRAVEALADVSTVEVQPRLLGKLLTLQLTPSKKKKEKPANEATSAEQSTPVKSEAPSEE